jgi:hypothetical protein
MDILGLLKSINLFDLARVLVVFGFTLAVILFSNKITDFKTPRPENRKKLLFLGYGTILSGLVIILCGAATILKEEALSLKDLGLDIFAMGISCICQYKFSIKKQWIYLKNGAYIVIGIGFVVYFIAVFAKILKWF